ncbi:MAG: hypothetical protein PHU25_14090 [Deltaproteobacteria bacterium]|nr:hypothetical protein [Deltaproteobacteria bacterium]
MRTRATISAAASVLFAIAAGRAAADEGGSRESVDRARAECTAEKGDAAACLRWASMARARDDGKSEKRALATAVTLDPGNVRARFGLGLLLAENRDYAWAAEHLSEAAALAGSAADRALVNYYLGYALLKDGKAAEAASALAKARGGLPAGLAQRCDFYAALAAREIGDETTAARLMGMAAGGKDARWSDAARGRLASWTAFPRVDGVAAQVSASLGVNTHPTSAFLDSPDEDSLPVLQSAFRGDVLYGFGSYAHGGQATLTLYREQNWLELGHKGNAPAAADSVVGNAFTPADFNATVILGQAAYVGRGLVGGLENELRLGAEGEVQLLDHVPVRSSALAPYAPSEDLFGLATWAVGARLGWSIALAADTVLGARLKVELRPNEIDPDRSAVRTRLDLQGSRSFLGRRLELDASVGGRYDRTYDDPAVIKYDRLLLELSADLVWRTPWKRLTARAGGGFEYGSYLNSVGDAANSFRPAWADNPRATEAENSAFEADYYDLAREDVEWEARAELDFALWWKAVAVITYKHHARISNIDDLPVPAVDTGDGFVRVPEPRYGYDEDVAMLELRQGF